MADINFSSLSQAANDSTPDSSKPSSQERGEIALELIELLFFAYRDFTGDPDALLQADGFGRAHHRVMHFVARNPGLRVADLLEILKITKQSLSRVLRQLVDEGYIEQRTGPADKRERRLFATERGQNLAQSLASPQIERILNALDGSPPDTLTTMREFLLLMVNADERPHVRDLTKTLGQEPTG